MNYHFITDSDSDLPLSFQQEHNIPVVYMPYSLDGKEYYDDLGQTVSSHDFFEKMRQGAKPTTSALNEDFYLEFFEPFLQEKDVLFIAFSSQLSCTIQAVYSAREKLLASYPDRKFVVVDTLSISAPMSVLVMKAHEMYRNGASIEEVTQWLEANKLRSHAWLTVDSLEYLKRGGRISSTAAVLGTLLDLKPILTITKEGKLVAADKVRGRKKAMAYIVDKAVELIEDPTEAECILVHADALPDAQRLKEMLLSKIPALIIRIENVGPVIGAHAGPGTVAFSFLGKERTL